MPLPRIAYVNGRYLPARDALGSIEDRGYQLSDGSYGVCDGRGSAISRGPRHLRRLPRTPPVPRNRCASEAWFVDRDGRVTEGASSNAWIVTQDGTVVTRPADNGILRGITRTVLIGAIKAQNLLFEERPFTVEEAYGACEAFVTAA